MWFGFARASSCAYGYAGVRKPEHGFRGGTEARMYDKVCNIISKVTGAILLLAALLLLLVQVPAVQSFAGRKILEKVQDKLEG